MPRTRSRRALIQGLRVRSSCGTIIAAGRQTTVAILRVRSASCPLITHAQSIDQDAIVLPPTQATSGSQSSLVRMKRMNETEINVKRRQPASRADWTNLLRRLGVKPSRSMGQNFLVEPEVVRRIADASSVKIGSRVVEIGPGLGILTRELLARGCRLTAVELDDELAQYLVDDLRDDEQFSLVRHDARSVDIGELTRNSTYQLVANLPYSMATVIIRHFVESSNPPTQLTVMVQREVAERMTASPPQMSLLGLATQFYTEAHLRFIVPPGSFLPPPKVESAVLTLEVRNHVSLDPHERERMFSFAAMAFQRKRKTIANGLSQGLGLEKGEIETFLSEAGIDHMRRPQTLSVNDWISLTQAIPG